MRVFLVVVFLTAGNPLYVPAVRQTPQKIDYDTFCKLPDVAAKRSAFVTAPPDTQAMLVRTPVERWRDANRPALTKDQAGFLDDLLKALTAETYGEGAKSPETQARMRDLRQRQRALFTEAQVQAMEPNGPCLPKGKSSL